MSDFAGWIVDDNVGKKYLEKCQLFADNDDAFANFRRDPDYTKILEGGQRVVGEIHINRLIERGNIRFLLDNAKRFRENDKYGNPVLLNFDLMENINPCTLLYISQLADIRVVIKDFKPKKILEIGGGFGGFCKIFSCIYNFDKYYMIDLPPAIALAKKYLNHFPEIYPKIKFIPTDELVFLDPIKNIDLFIASASLSELDEKAQNYYIDNFLLNSKFGYIVYNGIEKEERKHANFAVKISRYFRVLVDNSFGGIDILLLENLNNGK